MFDDLSAQLREAGLPMPGTAASCRWLSRRDAPGGPVEGALVADGAPDFPIDGLECGARASTGAEHPSTDPPKVDAYLQWTQRYPGALWVSWGTSLIEEGPYSIGATGLTDTNPGSEAVPDPARGLLPDRAPPEEPSAGDEFGGRANCFDDESDDRFVLPEGARLIATEGGPEGHSVLAVDDLEATMDALADRGTEPDFTPDDRELVLPEGRTVPRRLLSVQAGGAYEVLASADGIHLLISMHGD